jgi:putative addiction module component (TIGR02574 family)
MIMPELIQKFEEQALKLPAHDRALLAERLIASLDEPNTAENERMWVEEAEARYEAYKRGEVASYSAEDAIREIRDSLK